MYLYDTLVPSFSHVHQLMWHFCLFYSASRALWLSTSYRRLHLLRCTHLSQLYPPFLLRYSPTMFLYLNDLHTIYFLCLNDTKYCNFLSLSSHTCTYTCSFIFHPTPTRSFPFPLRTVHNQRIIPTMGCICALLRLPARYTQLPLSVQSLSFSIFLFFSLLRHAMLGNVDSPSSFR